MAKDQPGQLSSLDDDHMTPEWVVEGFRHAFNNFNLDPASSKFANQLVKAEQIFTSRGLEREWYGTVFLNPPGGIIDGKGRRVIRAHKVDGKQVKGCTETGACGLKPGHTHADVGSSAVRWWERLSSLYVSGDIRDGAFVGFSLELLQSAQARLCPHPLDFLACIPKQRIQFDRREGNKRVPGTAPTHSNILVCLSHDKLVQKRFKEAFAQRGYINLVSG